MGKKWTVGDTILYRDISVSHEQLVQELHFGWAVFTPIIFGPGKGPSFETSVTNSIHTNARVARRYGLKDCIVPGIRLFAHIADMFLEEFGEVWAESGTLSARFVAPALEGEVFRTLGTLKQVVDVEGGKRLSFDVAVVDKGGNKLVQGEAHLTIP
jgi:hypothetical protein